jgi:hypothetical protein
MKFISLLFCGLLVFTASERASAFVEVNGFFFNDTLTIGTTNSTSRMIFEGAIGFAVDRKKRYNVGWNYSMHSATDKTTTTAKYTASQMGPRLLWILDKKGNWSAGFGYYLVSKAKYDDGQGNAPEWKGSAFKVDAGYNYEISENFFAGIRLNYSSASYSEQLVQSTTYSNVSYKRSMIYPSLSSVYMF